MVTVKKRYCVMMTSIECITDLQWLTSWCCPVDTATSNGPLILLNGLPESTRLQVCLHLGSGLVNSNSSNIVNSNSSNRARARACVSSQYGRKEPVRHAICTVIQSYRLLTWHLTRNAGSCVHTACFTASCTLVCAEVCCTRVQPDHHMFRQPTAYLQVHKVCT